MTGNVRIGAYCAAAMAVVLGLASLAYRVEHPSIVVHEERAALPPASMGASMAEIKTLMERLRSNPEDLDVARELGMIFMRMGAWERALEFWDHVLAQRPTDLEALNQKGVCLFQTSRYREAAGVFSQMLAVDPAHPHAHYNLGILYGYYLNATDEARRHFEVVAAGSDPRLAAQAREDLAALGRENALTPSRP
jgi:Flp pilus assembly protein TadD